MKKILTLVLLIHTFASYSQQTSQTDTIYLNITVQQADSLIQENTSNPDFVILDVRTAGEYNGGHIIGAINIDYYATNFGALIDTLNRDRMYLVYCGSGSRSAKARDTMYAKHFVEVYNMLGGMGAWLGAGYPTSTTTSAANSEIEVINVKLYPNPVVDKSVIEISGISTSNNTIEVYDMTGKHIRTFHADVKTLINHEDFNPGIYFYQIKCKDVLTNKGKFAVE